MLTYILTSKYTVATLSPNHKMGRVRNESQDGWSLYLPAQLEQVPTFPPDLPCELAGESVLLHLPSTSSFWFSLP